jgi:hypothetical protein
MRRKRKPLSRITTVRFTEEQYEQLAAVADADDLAVGELIRVVMIHHLSELEQGGNHAHIE